MRCRQLSLLRVVNEYRSRYRRRRAAEAFALGLARAGIPLAKFFQFTNTALGKAIVDPKLSVWTNARG
jgi:hypothetical protein